MRASYRLMVVEINVPPDKREPAYQSHPPQAAGRHVADPDLLGPVGRTTMAVVVLLGLVAATGGARRWPVARAPGAPSATSRICCTVGGLRATGVVEELLAASDDELLGVMQRNVESLLSPTFLGTLRRVGRQAPTEEGREAAKRLEFSVVVFLEELIEHVQELERAEAAGELVVDIAANPVADNIPRRADGTNAATTRSLRPRTPMPRPPPTPAQAEARAVRSKEEALVEHRALLQDLLAEASKDIQSLENCLQRMAAARQLDGPFLEHLKWEMNEQARRGNAKLLHILQIVVQRACLAAESMLSESSIAAHHLSTILQIHDRDARHDYWKRVIVRLPEADRTQFSKAVCNVFADLGLRVQRGIDVDDSLLRQIRLVRDELDEHFM